MNPTGVYSECRSRISETRKLPVRPAPRINTFFFGRPGTTRVKNQKRHSGRQTAISAMLYRLVNRQTR